MSICIINMNTTTLHEYFFQPETAPTLLPTKHSWENHSPRLAQKCSNRESYTTSLAFPGRESYTTSLAFPGRESYTTSLAFPGSEVELWGWGLRAVELILD